MKRIIITIASIYLIGDYLLGGYWYNKDYDPGPFYDMFGVPVNAENVNQSRAIGKAIFWPVYLPARVSVYLFENTKS